MSALQDLCWLALDHSAIPLIPLSDKVELYIILVKPGSLLRE